MTKLLLARHGRTRLHQAGRFWGSTDVPLSETGIEQAEKLRDRLASEKIDAVYSSNLSRTRDTAGIIAAPHGRNVTAVPDIDECNFGFVEGLTFDEIQAKYPELAETLLGSDLETCFPGGESFTQFDARVQKFLPVIRKHDVRDTVLVVGHGGLLPLLICHFLGISIRYWRQFRIEQGSLSIMEVYDEITVLTLLNDTSHLVKKGD